MYISLAHVAHEIACLGERQYRVSSANEVYLVEQPLHNLLLDFKKEGSSQYDVYVLFYVCPPITPQLREQFVGFFKLKQDTLELLSCKFRQNCFSSFFRNSTITKTNNNK